MEKSIDRVQHILERAKLGELLDKADACALLGIPNHSREYFDLLYAANDYSRVSFQNRGMVFAQIGLDMQPCGINCRFCSFAKDTLSCRQPVIKSMEDTLAEAKLLVESGIDDLFLMTTAEFSQKAFLQYGKAVREIMPKHMRLVANVGDFDADYANRLKDCGFTGVYHICRLREGVDTCADPATRLHTMNAAKEAGLELYYCVEPIGPEHTDEELADEMLRGRQYAVPVMAVMKRIPVPGTPLASNGEISAATLAKICAVATLVSRPMRAMCVHEPDELCLMAGANQLYAECGSNPRDVKTETRDGRGFSVSQAKMMLSKTEWN